MKWLSNSHPRVGSLLPKAFEAQNPHFSTQRSKLYHQFQTIEEMASSGMKGFYKQKKKGAGAPKPGKSSGDASVGADSPTQPPALVAHGSFDPIEEYGEEEAKLRQFDMNMRFGPCISMTRLRRWERAYGARPTGRRGPDPAVRPTL